MFSRLIIFVFGIILSLLAACGEATPTNSCPQQVLTRHHDEGELIFSQLLWRHGDRTPAFFWPTDPHQGADNWEVGLGQLTNIGKNQHFKLGKWLRQRYNVNNFLSRNYSENEIYVRSTDVDRTLASAYSNLAGLYPPTGVQIWNKHLLWQPIPVHTMPEKSDFMLGAELPACPAFNKLLQELFDSEELTTFVDSYQDIIDIINANIGLVATSTQTKLQLGLIVRDNFFIERIYSKALPDWSTQIYPTDRLDQLALLWYVLPAYTEDLARFRVGYLLKDILDRAQAKANGTLKPDRKVWVFSAHDSNVATVLYGLGLFDGEFVQYAATLLFELHRKADNEVYLSISYRKKADDDHAEKLCIPNCGFQCKLSDVYRIYKNILPTQDFATACRL